MTHSGRASRGRLILALGCTSALGPFSLDLYLPALPELSVELGASETAGQLTMSACLIGLSVGQIVAGPLSDRHGRRRPLLIGLMSYVLLTVLCAFAPSIEALVALRALQGLVGATGIVLARAIVRDLFDGREVARVLSLLVLVAGAAPLIAPILGGQLLKVLDWRGVFLVLASVALGIAVLAARTIRESLPPDRRHAGGLGAVASGFGRVFTDPLFTSATTLVTLSGAALFTYISASPFVLQDGYGLTPEQYSFVFAGISAGIAVLGLTNAVLVRRIHPRILIVCAMALATIGALACVVTARSEEGLWALLASLFVAVASASVAAPNATALALSRQARDAGTAAAVVGTGPFLAGAAVAPLALMGGASASALALLMFVLTAAALVVAVLAVRPIARPDLAGGQLDK